MKIDHITAANNLHALAAAATALDHDTVDTAEGKEARKAVFEAIRANAETLKEQTA